MDQQAQHDEKKRAVREIVQQLFAGDVPKVEAILRLLDNCPMHYQKLHRLSAKQEAVIAYLDFLHASAPSAPAAEAEQALSADAAGASTVPLAGSSDDVQMLVTDHDVSEMRQQYLEYVGMEIEPFQEPWFLVPECVQENVELGAKVFGGTSLAFGGHYAAQAAGAGASSAGTAVGLVTFDTFTVAVQTLSTSPLTSMTEAVEKAVIAQNLEAAPEILRNVLGKGATQTEQLAKQANTAANYAPWIKHGGQVLTVGLLGYGFYSAIRRYYKKQIDSYRLAQDIAALVLSTGAGAAGAMGAAALCSGAGPVGIAFVACAGAVAAATLTDKAVHNVFHQLFGDDRERALKNAYAELGLLCNAAPPQIRAGYLHLARLSHPDKPGGSHEKFLRVNAAYELVRASRLAQ